MSLLTLLSHAPTATVNGAVAATGMGSAHLQGYTSIPAVPHQTVLFVDQRSNRFEFPFGRYGVLHG